MVLALAVATLAWGEPAWSQTPSTNAGVTTSGPVAPTPAGNSSAAPPEVAPPKIAPPKVVETAPRPENHGLINEIGKLFERRPALFPALKWPPPAADDINVVDKEAGESLPNLSPNPLPSVSLPSLLPNPSSSLKVPSFEKGREKCPAAENGASDCKAAADALCRAKGYQQGKSTDTDATQRCSAEALLLSNRKSAPGACRTDYFVTRAWCQ